MSNLEKGFYLKARCIEDSYIATAPPHVREIWDLLLRKANYSDTKMLKRGQCLMSYADIVESLKWFSGYRLYKYSKDQCTVAMRSLRGAGMITTTKTKDKTLITICNYDTYQRFENYGNNIGNNTVTMLETTRSPHHIEKEKQLKTNNIYVHLNGFDKHFEKLWSRYPKKLGKKAAMRHFKSSVKTEKDVEDIKTALKNFLESDACKRDMEYIQHGSTWFNNWKDWLSYTEQPKQDEKIKYRAL